MGGGGGGGGGGGACVSMSHGRGTSNYLAEFQNLLKLTLTFS